MGNDGSERRFTGVIDSTLFTTHALTAEQVLALTCFRPRAPTVTVTPVGTVSTPAGVAVAFDYALGNNNPTAACGPIAFDIVVHEESFGVTFDPPANVTVRTPRVPHNSTAHFIVTATPSEDFEPGRFLSFHTHVDHAATGVFGFFSHSLVIAEPDPTICSVNTSRELMIKHTSVVDDPVRTTFTPGSTDPRNGVWTFKRLMEDLAPTPGDAPAMVETMLTSIATPQVINGFSIAGRSGMGFLLDNWPRSPDGALDLAQAPLRLQAIVNRFDLRDLASGDAGEGRFVFAFEFFGSPLSATMILEYKLPAATDSDVLGWASAFHGLGALPFGESYNAALQEVTTQFAGRGARPGHPNASAINAVRTNEISLGDNGIWELREFRMSPASGLLEPVPVELTPSNGFNGSSTLASYINANQAVIIAEQHTVPAVFQGQPFQGGAVFNQLNAWIAPGTDSDARHHFSLNTCNGCHSTAEANVFFLQINPRFQGSEAALSPFLTGTTVFDPVTGQARTFNDLARRKDDLKAVVCDDGAGLAAGTSLRKGIDRVH